MLFLFLLILPLAQGTSPYVPGTPGAPWTDYELLTGEFLPSIKFLQSFFLIENIHFQ